MSKFLILPKRYLRMRIGRPMVRAADRHRNQADWIEAIIGYRRALAWMPWREDLHIQVGNCFKEYGDYRSAVKAYSLVTSGAHRSDALREMMDANHRAGSEILPYIVKDGPQGADGGAALVLSTPNIKDFPSRISIDTEDPRRWLGRLGRTDNRATRARGNSHPSIVFEQVGAMSIQREGAFEPLLAGVVAIRLKIFSVAKLETVELWLGQGDKARLVETALVRPVTRGFTQIRLHVANIWLDAAALPAGRHWLSIRAGDHAPENGLFVNIPKPGNIEGLDSSDSYIPSPAGTGDVAARVLAQPTEVRRAARGLFDQPITSILALRADQLGDVAASLPALVRLRALFPDAWLTALVQPGVRSMVEASRIVDEVLSIRLDYNEATERRLLAIDEEERVRSELAERHFDLAIDLSPGDETRPLLLLANATYLVGFEAERFPFLDHGITLRTRDKVNKLGKISHAASVLNLIESLAVAIEPDVAPVPRQARADDILTRHAIIAQKYIVLHTGARHAINCWPAKNFYALAERLLAETSFTIVLFSSEASESTCPALLDNPRVKIFDLLDMNEFDAILSHAKVMVGNDSGPKHLAATRGVKTVSVHIDRLNWNEWGQHGTGTILSKRVPCTGCVLNDVQLCGREAACVRSVTVDDVFAAVGALL